MEAPKIRIDDPDIITFYLCYLLYNLGGKLTMMQLTEITTTDEMVNYFDLVTALGEMEENGLVTTTDENKTVIYKLTEKGGIMGANFDSSIPLSIREKSIELGKTIKARDELARAISCEILPAENGYFLHVSFLNEMGGENLVEIKIFIPSYEGADKMRKRLYENPSEILMEIIKLFS